MSTSNGSTSERSLNSITDQYHLPCSLAIFNSVNKSIFLVLEYNSLNAHYKVKGNTHYDYKITITIVAVIIIVAAIILSIINFFLISLPYLFLLSFLTTLLASLGLFMLKERVFTVIICSLNPPPVRDQI